MSCNKFGTFENFDDNALQRQLTRRDNFYWHYQNVEYITMAKAMLSVSSFGLPLAEVKTVIFYGTGTPFYPSRASSSRNRFVKKFSYAASG